MLLAERNYLAEEVEIMRTRVLLSLFKGSKQMGKSRSLRQPGQSVGGFRICGRHSRTPSLDCRRKAKCSTSHS